LSRMAKRFEFHFPQVSYRLKAAPKQCPHANPMFVVFPLSYCLPCPCALLHYDLDVGVLASTHSTGGACCASARLDVVYGYHPPSSHRPLEMRLPSQVCKYALRLVVILCRLTLNNTLKSVVKLMTTLLIEHRISCAIHDDNHRAGRTCCGYLTG
jgi:hypothetical protein